MLRKLRNRALRTAATKLYRKPLLIDGGVPIITFTFDDFPRSALLAGGEILESYGCAASYFASGQLMGATVEPGGPTFIAEDLHRLRERGHELGCHTFEHLDARETSAPTFARSIETNGQFFRGLGFDLRTSSYAKQQPRPSVKRIAGRAFECSRGGGQTHNSAVADSALLAGFFLEQSRDEPQNVVGVIEANRRDNGWLIFATHDIDAHPSPYGCDPQFFRTIVEASLNSGAKIMTMHAAWLLLSGLKTDAANHNVSTHSEAKVQA